MMNNLPNIKERILYLSEIVEVSKQKFFKTIGITYSNFTGDKKKRPVNSDAIENILLKYPQTNPEWLLMGKGEMLKQERETPQTVATYNSNGIPLLPFEAFAGVGDTNIKGVNFDTIEERYDVPLFHGTQVDFMLPVKGSSMYPKYSSGDVVACRLVQELLFVQWNKVYVLDTITQGIIMKRLKKSESEDSIICVSDNKNYDPFVLPLSEIRTIALVVGVIRLE